MFKLSGTCPPANVFVRQRYKRALAETSWQVYKQETPTLGKAEH